MVDNQRTMESALDTGQTRIREGGSMCRVSTLDISLSQYRGIGVRPQHYNRSRDAVD